MTPPTPPMPERIAKLARDRVGRPVPWFVAWIDGEPDFRIIGYDKLEDAHRFSLCWVCGQRRGRNVSFVIGPMCAVNRTSAEPPAHYDCATYSALACPFLNTPQMVRREGRLPDLRVQPAGHMIARNPGVALVWSTRNYKPFSDGRGGVLFELGDPTEVHWYAKGRMATRSEVMESINTGMPILLEQAEAEGRGAVIELGQMRERALTLVPA